MFFESGIAFDTIFNKLQFIKKVGMGWLALHTQLCCDQKYVENLAVIFKFVILNWIFHFVL